MMSWKTKMLRRCTAVLLLAAVITASVFALSVSAQLFGDIDGDGKITYDDAQLVFDYVAGCGKLSWDGAPAFRREPVYPPGRGCHPL